MPAMQEDRPTDQRNPAHDQFVEYVAQGNAGRAGRREAGTGDGAGPAWPVGGEAIRDLQSGARHGNVPVLR